MPVMAQPANNLSPDAKKVLELLLAGRVDEAAQYIDEKYTLRLQGLQRQMNEVSQERGLLMNTLQLAKRERMGGLMGLGMQVPRTVIIPMGNSNTGKPETRRDKILGCAIDVAKKNDGKVKVQQVVDALLARQIDLGTAMPNTSVGVTLHRSDEWKREAPAVFRYVGPQLDLKRTP